MSLPNYLARIKSSGMYRFTFDKSQVPPQAAETMRLVIGYSDKGPFNNPVYIDNKQDFISLFGNINKRLEKKGVFFHRLALQALSAGPILALNLKPFRELGDDSEQTEEAVSYVSFNPCDTINVSEIPVRDIYDINRFWKIDADQLAHKIADKEGTDYNTNAIKHGYINIATTDTKEQSCTFFIRKVNVKNFKQYDVTLRDWYLGNNEEMPEYLEDLANDKVYDYLAEIYVFKGNLDGTAIVEADGTLGKYFNTAGDINPAYVNAFGKEEDALSALADDPNSNFVGVYQGSLLPYFKDMNGHYISLDILFNADKDTHKMIMKLDDDIIDYVLGDVDGEVRLKHWYSTDSVSPVYLKGYEYNTLQKGSTAKQIHDASLGVLTEDGIYNALTNHVDSEYHYIVDTFASRADEAGFGKKINICMIAKAKENCLAIMNFPGNAEIARELKGYTPEALDNFNISMPSEANGASYCAFYTPLVFGDNSVKQVVPSAALVSNNFMEKWNSRQPYYIVAGPNYGVMNYEGLIGPDYNYSRADLDVLEPFGVNCMVYVPRKGTYINSNQTAKQIPVSALSKVHVRELVIYLQDEIERMMQNYQWELNTQTLRDTIKTKADTILERVKANGGVYDYINVCDGTNNTPEVIDNEMIILDTSIEPARGAGKMVQRLTIHRTGGISSLTK